MLKVAFIGDVLFPIPDIKGGAISTLVTGIINENEKHPELDITVFSADCDGLLECHNQYRFTKFHRIGKPDKLIKLKVLFWRMIRKLTGYRVQYKNAFMMMVNRLLRNEQYDVIVYENSALEMMQAKRYKNTKNIMHIHADYINSDMNGINYLCRHCDCVMGVSDFITSKMEEIPALKGKGVTLKNAIDLTGFTPKHRPEDGEGIRESLGLSENDFVVLFCGRLSKEKGCLELIKAVERVPDVKLLIVGGENFSSNARTEYVECLYNEAEKIKDRIVFTGHIKHSEVIRYYINIADIAVVPSICNEAASLTLLEYRATGLPTIASKMGGIPEYCNKNTTLLVEYHESFIEGLAEAIQLLKCDDMLRDRMSEQATLDLEQFGYTSYYKNFVDIIANVSSESKEYLNGN